MAQMAIKIIKTDSSKLIDMLNVAFAEEWLAYYQYWIGAHLAVGILRHAVADEFMEHAKEELEHAEKLAKRIGQLGGVPLINPNLWEKVAECKYEEPKNPCTCKLLEQNLTAERCAIARYQKICEMTEGTDFVTFHLAREILEEEIEHEQELFDYLNDLEHGCCEPKEKKID